MSYKAICDCCQSEFNNQKEHGGLMKRNEIAPIWNTPGGIVLSKELKELVVDLCSNCQKFLWGKYEERKESFDKGRAETRLSTEVIKIK